MCKKTFVLMTLILVSGLAGSVSATNYCISPDGSSANSGLDWNNAWRQLPGSLTRGDTYYFADGSYDSYTFDDSPSATYITIKKATAADHGTDTGWQSSYGDGVASFSNCAFSNTSYIILDGQVEDGFTLIKEGLGGTVVNITSSDYITLRNCDLDGNFATLSGGEPTSHTNGACNVLHADSSSYLTIENCKLHNVADDGLEIHSVNNLLIAGNEIYKLYGCGTDGGCGDCYNGHSDGIEIFDVDNAEFKENIVYDIRSTAAFICDNWTTDPANDSTNVTMVNNIFYSPETGFCIYLDSMHGVDATHNVFWGLWQGSYGGLSISNVTDLDMYNNIILSINYSHMGDEYNASEHRGDYNLFGYDTGQYPLQTNDILDSDPNFENIPDIYGPADREVVAEDFRLTSASSARDAGTNMGITVDFFGNTRPQGSGYDIGAHEYIVSGNISPVADAGSDQTVVDSDENSSETVSLDGSGSYDPDGTIESYVWKEGVTQIATGVDPNVVFDVNYHEVTLEVTDNNSATDTDTVIIIVNTPTAVTSTSSWQNFSIDSQTGSFTFEYDTRPNNNNMDGVTGLSQGDAADYTDLACILRFDVSGNMDVRNGSAYGADTTLSYSAGDNFHVRMEIDISSHTYSVYVTPEGQSEVTLATDYAFRTGQGSVTSLDRWVVIAGVGSHMVDNAAVSGGPTPTLPWSDGFESGDLTTGGWTISGSASASDKAAYTGTYGAKVAKDSWMEKAISTVGFTTIHAKYVRKTKGMDSGEYLYVEWYDGSDWNNLESTQDTNWASKDLTCGTGANNNASFKLRFRTNSSNASEYAYIDDVEITGTQQ